MLGKTIKYELSDDEVAARQKFLDEHKPCRDKYVAELGGRGEFAAPGIVAYKITSCSIGQGLDVICPFCKESKDITDYDCW